MKTPKSFRLYLALLFFIAVKPSAFAQTTIYSTNFGTTVGGSPSSWTFTGVDMNISTHSPKSSGYTGASGQAYLSEGNSADFTNTFGTFFGHSQAGTSAATLVVNTSGYSSITLSFGMYKSTSYDSNVSYSLQWSADGNSFTPIIFTQPTAGNWGLASGSGLNLPSGAGNQLTLYIRWSFNRTGPNFGVSFRLDDVKILGTVSTCTSPSITSVSSNSPVCVGTTINLTSSASGTDPIIYSWTGPNGFTSTNQNPSIPGATAAASGTYTVMATNSCGTALATISVIVNPSPTVTTNATATSVCVGSTLTLTGNGATTYIWSGGVSNGIPFIPSSTTTYTVTGTDANGCSATTSITPIVNPLPAVPVITPASNTTFCHGDSVVLTSSLSTGYQWNSNQTSQSITADSSGNYVVTISDINGCTASSAPVTVTINPLPSTSITPSGPTTFCPGGSVTLTVEPAVSYLWSTGDTTQSVFVDTTGNYSVTVTDINGCTATSIIPQAVTIVADPTDINRDGITNNIDFLLLIGHFNNNCTLCNEDINHDGIINNVDFLILLAHFNMSCQL